MEANRALLATFFFGLAAAGFLLLGQPPAGPELSEAKLSPMGTGYALTVKITNSGTPDRLLSVSAEDAASVMAIGASGDGLPIPADASPGLSMDGAHAMLMGLTGSAEEGRLVPVVLKFEKAGSLTTRARIGGAGMAHDQTYPVPADEAAPSVALSVRADGDGWIINANTQNFQFSKEAVDTPHQPGIGHGHLYLDGLKLQRLYQPDARIGALLPGSYTVRVTLNTNDHRPYMVQGKPVTAIAEITVD